MVRVHVDYIIASGEHDMHDEFFHPLKQRLPVKNLGELKMYNDCAFERDWYSGILEMNQMAFAKNMVEQYNIPATSNIPGSPGLDLGPRKDGESGVMRNFGSTGLWLGVSCDCQS